MPEVTLDTKVVLELLTGESEEIKALSVLMHPEIDPNRLSRGEEPPSQPPEYYEQLQRMLNAQEGAVIPSGPVVSSAVMAGQPMFRYKLKGDWAKLNFGWLPLNGYPGKLRFFEPDGGLANGVVEPLDYNSAVFTSAIIQYRARAHNLLDMIVYSDLPVTDASGVVTVKAIITFVKQMPEEAYERPEWLMNLLSQDSHLMRHELRTISKARTSTATRFNRDEVVEIDKTWDIPENARRMAAELDEESK